MKTKTFLLLSLLLTGLLVLSACAPEATPEKQEEPAKPEEVIDESSSEEPTQAPQEEDAADSDSVEEPYPAPQDAADNPFQNQTYPGIEVVGSATDRDLSEAIMSDGFAVLSSDKDLQIGPAFIETSEIIIKEGSPAQVELILVGNLPTPCNHLRVVTSEPDENGHIKVDAYSVSDPDKMCSQVLNPFIAVVPLGEFSDGAFTLSVNNELEGEFKLP